MDEVIADYVSGMSATACGRKHGIDPHTVLSNLSKRGIVVRPRPGPLLASEKLQRARDLRAQGWSYQAIGDELGVCHTTARTALIGTANNPPGTLPGVLHADRLPDD